MRVIKAKVGNMLQLGKIGTSDTTKVIFDVSGWTDGLTGYSFELIHQRYGDDEPYPISVTYSETDNTVTWVVANSDVAVAGWGKAELILVAGSAVAKSQTFGTVVHKALGEALDPPAEYQTWVDQVLAAGSAAKVSAAAAAESATNAATSETNAAGSATSASNSATAASNSATSASNSATAATSAANSAGESAISANNSATSAASSATSAGTSATNAGNSATSAANSATSASGSATAASGSATSAASSASTAEQAKKDTVSAAEKALTDIGSAKTEAVKAVTDEGTTQVQKVKDEGASYQTQITQNTNDISELNKDLAHVDEVLGEDPADDDEKWEKLAEEIEEANDGYSAMVDLCINLPQASMGEKINSQLEIENTHLKNILKEMEEGLRL